jgi:hypothetical protein
MKEEKGINLELRNRRDENSEEGIVRNVRNNVKEN